MMISFLSKGLVLALGYAYPAYECYKTVEMEKPEIEQLRFWCHYWILVAVLTIFERAGEAFISWLPMYNAAKLAFFIYLWYPRTRGSTRVYESLLRPFIAEHEREIDQSLVEIRIRSGDTVVWLCKKATEYSQSRIFDILQYIAAQSVSLSPSSVQQQHRDRPITSQRSHPFNRSPHLGCISNPASTTRPNPNPNFSDANSAGTEFAMLSEEGKISPAEERVNATQKIPVEGKVRVNHGRLRARPGPG